LCIKPIFRKTNFELECEGKKFLKFFDQDQKRDIFLKLKENKSDDEEGIKEMWGEERKILAVSTLRYDSLEKNPWNFYFSLC
jgi:hypothetical protein